jgi:hypothetical protein
MTITITLLTVVSLALAVLELWVSGSWASATTRGADRHASQLTFGTTSGASPGGARIQNNEDAYASACSIRALLRFQPVAKHAVPHCRTANVR